MRRYGVFFTAFCLLAMDEFAAEPFFCGSTFSSDSAIEIRTVHSAYVPTPQDEFETREEYELRLTESRDSIPSGPHVFRVPDAALTSHYSADRELLSLSLPIGQFHDGSHRTFYGAAVDEEVTRRRQYAASNAYGASITVEEVHKTVWGIRSAKLPHVQLKVERDRARSLKPAIKVYLIVQVREGDISTSVEDATFTSPYEIHALQRFLDPSTVGLLVVDGRNDQVIYRSPEAKGLCSRSASD